MSTMGIWEEHATCNKCFVWRMRIEKEYTACNQCFVFPLFSSMFDAVAFRMWVLFGLNEANVV